MGWHTKYRLINLQMRADGKWIIQGPDKSIWICSLFKIEIPTVHIHVCAKLAHALTEFILDQSAVSTQSGHQIVGLYNFVTKAFRNYDKTWHEILMIS